MIDTTMQTMSKITIDWYKDGDYQHNLVSLLACLNGDAGQYQVKHGTQRAMEYALERFYSAIDNTTSEGTWAWACNQMLAGNSVTMTSPDGEYIAKFYLSEGMLVCDQSEILIFTEVLFRYADWKLHTT